MVRRLVLMFAASATACAPALNWREVRPEGSGVRALFPCKPTREARRLRLAGAEVEMTLHACSAAGATWALAHVDVADPVRVTPALRELAAAASRNVDARNAASAPLAVAGMTPNSEAQHLQFRGARPDGRPVSIQAAVFAYGTRVYQATVVSPPAEAGAVQTFFQGLRVSA
jgi:hypothetical protein